MANRSYLYAADQIPGKAGDISAARIIGISEWAYDIPISFKLLVSGNPRKCRSLICGEDEPLAICGDFASGVERLICFLDQRSDPELKTLRDEAFEYLRATDRQRKLFVLEPFEIFWLMGEEIDEYLAALLDEVTSLESGVETTPKVESERRALCGRLRSLLFGQSGRKPTHLNVKDLGLGNWDEVLFYDPNGSSGAE